MYPGAGTFVLIRPAQTFYESILERIYNQIGKADIVISDVTGRSPNVFYETGYAHALGKTVILLASTADDIPFDLQHYSHIVYEGRISYLKEELQRRVRWYIENPSDGSRRPLFQLELYVQGEKLELDRPVEVAGDWRPIATREKTELTSGREPGEWIRDTFDLDVQGLALNISMSNPKLYLYKGDFKTGFYEGIKHEQPEALSLQRRFPYRSGDFFAIQSQPRKGENCPTARWKGHVHVGGSA